MLEYWTSSMGIVKIVGGEPEAKDISNCEDEGVTKEERLLLQTFPSHEPDVFEHAEVGCELATYRGQICNIPYELYDLNELTEVLSLETWNLCLTEDDRVHLAAYLPDMDQGDFCTTMKELFSGDAIFFGSPLRSVFHRLNGGFYSPEVSQARVLLMTLERRRHYHFLRLYHDGIVQKFYASFREMVPIFHNWAFANRSNSNCVGHSSPSPPLIIDNSTASFSQPKRAKLMNRTSTTQCSTSKYETVSIAKLVELNSSESETIHSSQPKNIISAKGVLKTRIDCDYRTDISEGVHHIPGLILVNQLRMQSSSLCTIPRTCAQDVHGFVDKLSSRFNKINSGSSPLQWNGAPETKALMASPHGVEMTVSEELRVVYSSYLTRGFNHPAANHTSPYSSEAYYTRELPSMKNRLKNFPPHPHTRVRNGHQVNEYTTMHSLGNAKSSSQMLNVETRIYPLSNNFAEQLGKEREYHGGSKLAKSVIEVEEVRRSPCTYSRRKLHKRSLDIVDSVKSSATVETRVSRSVLASMNAMEIKL